jgi:hypothetical protein
MTTVICAKPAFGGPAQVLRYLGRYTHRVAISNHRLLRFDGELDTFRWRSVRRRCRISVETIRHSGKKSQRKHSAILPASIRSFFFFEAAMAPPSPVPHAEASDGRSNL